MKRREIARMQRATLDAERVLEIPVSNVRLDAARLAGRLVART
jgi:hypothetical protein